MPESLQSVFYLIAGVLFIRSLAGLSQQKNARMGNMLGILGMALALSITFGHDKPYAWEWAIPALLVGGFIGWLAASKVEMTAMPELVAILHSFVGLAAVLVGFATYLAPSTHASVAEANIHLIEVFAAIAIGAVTLMGSIIAWAKLRGTLSGSPLLLPGRHGLNLALVGGLVVMGFFFVKEGHTELALQLLMGNALLSALLGLHLVLAIGGADMPVVVSLLNSYSGWAASAAGFMLNNDLLIVTGALVGSSGAILSYIMCRGMNRSIWNVVFGGFGAVKKGPAGPAREYGEVISADALQVATALLKAKVVVIIPGYGMAVARAQHAVSELTRRLNDNGCEVLFGVHEVAGRMPGHMNVLLAEADIPYDVVLEREHVNPRMAGADVTLVIGANDIVNPDALTDESSPIFGMPQLEVWDSKCVVVFKRSMSPGYAGVQNPLFFRPNTWMYFGDAREGVDNLLKHL